jgi:hypothetical protein
LKNDRFTEFIDETKCRLYILLESQSKFPAVVVASDVDDAVASSGAGDVDDGDSSVVEVLADAVDVVATVVVLVVKVVVDVGNLIGVVSWSSSL